MQDRRLVGGPGSLAPRDLENVFRRVHFLSGSFTTGPRAMGYTQVGLRAHMGMRASAPTSVCLMACCSALWDRLRGPCSVCTPGSLYWKS